MNKKFASLILKRFVKAFVAGGLASLAVLLATQSQLTTLVEWKTWGIALIYAFVVGGLLGLEKLYQGWKPPLQ